MKSQMQQQKTFSDVTAGALNAYGSLSKSPFISNMKTHTGYQFSKSGLNSRSAVPAKNMAPSSNPSFSNVVQQLADRSRQLEPRSRRDSNAHSTNRVLFEKQMKTSVT